MASGPENPVISGQWRRFGANGARRALIVWQRNAYEKASQFEN
jgi:hypothetical protein